MKSYLIHSFSLFLLFFTPTVFATFDTATPGESLWNVVKRVGVVENSIESRCDILEPNISISDAGLLSYLDVIESRIDNVVIPLAPTALTASHIITGTITVASAGNYILSTDLTTDIIITASYVSLDLNKRRLTGSIDVSDGDDIYIYHGILLPQAPAIGVPDAAITVTAASQRVIISDVLIQCTNSSGVNIAGRTGIEIAGDDAQIIGCGIVGGIASDGDATSSVGGNGGDGIRLLSTANRTIIKDCVLKTGKGANVSDAGGGTAGRAGHAIYVNNATNAQIIGIVVLETGAGGTDTSGLGTGGDGGDGVKIDSSSVDIAVWDCIIGRTGTRGTGGVNGQYGAVVDDVVVAGANESIVYANFAHNVILGYLLQASSNSGIIMPVPPTAAVINSFANVIAGG